MKKRMFFLAILLSLGLVGCQPANPDVDSESTKENHVATERDTEKDITTETEGLDNTLNQDKLDWFETVFFNQEENHITNMFLASEYASVADVNLGRLFHSGADGMGGNGEVPEEEATLVIDKFGLEKLDVAKATIAEMDAVLQKYAGLTIETTNKVGFDSLYYLEEKDAYYNVSGDTAYMKCNIVKGWTNEDGTITLQYKDALSSISDTFEVTLKAVDDSYQFVSNKRVAE